MDDVQKETQAVPGAPFYVTSITLSNFPEFISTAEPNWGKVPHVHHTYVSGSDMEYVTQKFDRYVICARPNVLRVGAVHTQPPTFAL